MGGLEMSSITKWLLFGIVAFQICSISAFGMYQEFLLRTGTYITLRVVPVDPRDLFRGEYVELRYDISTLRVAVYGTEAIGDYCCISGTASIGDQVLVGLVQGSDQPFASITSVPDGWFRDSSIHYVNHVGAMDQDNIEWQLETEVRIRGEIQGIRQFADAPMPHPNRFLKSEYFIEYGIERFFVPEGIGREIESSDDVKAVISVSKNGDAIIENLIVDGEMRYSR